MHLQKFCVTFGVHFRKDALFLFFVGLPHALYVNTAYLVIRICGKRSVQSVVCMRADENMPAAKASDYRRVIKVARCPTELNKVADFDFIQINFSAERSVALYVADKKVVKVFHSRPRRRALLGIYIIPTERRREVHNSAAGIETLRRVIRAIAAQVVEIEIHRIPFQRPFFGILDGFESVVFFDNHNTMYATIYHSVTLKKFRVQYCARNFRLRSIFDYGFKHCSSFSSSDENL